MKLLAQNFRDVIGTVDPPQSVSKLGAGGIGINNFINKGIELLYIVSALAVLFMLLLGAFQLITSGGDKEAVAKAKNRITYAIVGIVFLALVFFILQVLGKVIGIEFFKLTTPPAASAAPTVLLIRAL